MLISLLRLFPQKFHSISLKVILYMIIKRYPDLRDRLICLEGKRFMMVARDIQKRYYIDIENSILKSNYKKRLTPDVIIEGNFYDLIGLLIKRRDADSLFFSRRLRIEGDIEASVYFKNLLDSI
ncbi:MAG: SCP2 domain-containing protein [Nitrospirota bacterium]